MTMNIKKILRTSLLSLAVLGMVGGSISGTANARRRYHYRSHHIYRHKRYGYRYYHRNFSNKYSRYCRYYHTGYFIYGKGPEWVRYRSGYYDHYWHWHSYKISHRSSKSRNASAHKRSRFNPYKDGETAMNRELDREFWGTNYNPKLKRYFQRHHSYKQIHKAKPKKQSAYNDGLSRQDNIAEFGTAHPSKDTIKAVFNTPYPSQDKIQNFLDLNPVKGSSSYARDKAQEAHNNNPATIQQNLAEMKSQTLKDINADRQANGVAPLSESSELDQIAGMRAKQLNHVFSHVDANGNDYADDDARQLGYHTNIWHAENISGAELGSYNQYDGTPVNNHNGYDMANAAENQMMNHDQCSNWGHREDILNSHYSQLGVGTAYNNGKYHLAEDFY